MVRVVVEQRTWFKGEGSGYGCGKVSLPCYMTREPNLGDCKTSRSYSRLLGPFIGDVKDLNPVIGTDGRRSDRLNCRVLDERTRLAQVLHQSTDPIILEEVRSGWQGIVERRQLLWLTPVGRSDPCGPGRGRR